MDKDSYAALCRGAVQRRTGKSTFEQFPSEDEAGAQRVTFPTIEDNGDTVGKIMAYEGGEMSDDDTISFFQELVDSGMAWQLQGSYGRTATALIDAGLVTRAIPASRALDRHL